MVQLIETYLICF